MAQQQHPTIPTLLQSIKGVQSGLVVNTTCKWDEDKQVFILHTPDGGAKKNWISQGYVADKAVFRIRRQRPPTLPTLRLLRHRLHGVEGLRIVVLCRLRRLALQSACCRNTFSSLGTADAGTPTLLARPRPARCRAAALSLQTAGSWRFARIRCQ